MATFHYVYILVSESDTTRHYTGLTDNLAARLKAHNSGQLPYTLRHKPWIIDVAVAFRSRRKARRFETYLESHSGRTFAKKHF